VKIKTVLTVVFFLVIVPGSLGLLLGLYPEFQNHTQTKTGPGWHALGRELNVDPKNIADDPSLTIDSQGNPIVAWSESVNLHSPSSIYVKRWNGKQWVQLGSTSLNADSKRTAIILIPSLVVDARGNPSVAWLEIKDTESPGEIYVMRWNGSSWVELGSEPLNTDPKYDASRPSIVLDTKGNPVVAWSEQKNTDSPKKLYVKQWTGSKWVQIGSTPLNVEVEKDAVTENLVVNDQGYPSISWVEEKELSSSNFYAKCWDGRIWKQVISTRFHLDNHVPSGISSLVVNKNGAFNAVWSEQQKSDDFSTNLYVRYWSGKDWKQFGQTSLNMNPKVSAGYNSLVVDSNGNPIVAWSEEIRTSDSSYANIYVKHWNGTQWIELGPNSLNVSSKRHAFILDLALDAKNRPIVAWSEEGKIYVKRGLP
jgi:hypothetical protein